MKNETNLIYDAEHWLSVDGERRITIAIEENYYRASFQLNRRW